MIRKDATLVFFREKKKLEKMHSKISLKDFRDLHSPNLIIQIYSSNDPKQWSKCSVCDIISEFYKIVLNEKWREEWGDFDFVVEKLVKNDRSFICVGTYLSVDIVLILDDLIYIKK